MVNATRACLGVMVTIIMVVSMIIWYRSHPHYTYHRSSHGHQAPTVVLPNHQITTTNVTHRSQRDDNVTIMDDGTRTNTITITNTVTIERTVHHYHTDRYINCAGDRIHNGAQTLFDLSAVDGTHSRTLIAYAYYETENARDNAAYFFLVGVMPYVNHPSVDILIILMSDLSVALPNGKNIFVHQRFNIGMDICAWHETMQDPIMEKLTGHSVSSYRYIIWMNASVRGPFLPLGTPFDAWLPYFLSQITEHTKLIGTTLNCMGNGDHDAYGGGPPYRYGQAHLQSMFLAFDWHILPLLLENCRCFKIKTDSIMKGEVMLTRGVLQAGYGIQPQMLPFRDVNWTNAGEADAACDYDHEQNPQMETDRMYPDRYYDITIQPLEVIFFKSNRHLLPKYLARYTEWNRRVAQRMYPHYHP